MKKQGGNQNSNFSSWSETWHLSILISSKTKRKCSLPSFSQEQVMWRGAKSGRTGKCFPCKLAAEPGPHYKTCGGGGGKPKIQTIAELKVFILFYTVTETLPHIPAHATLKVVKTDISSPVFLMLQGGEWPAWDHGLWQNWTQIRPSTSLVCAQTMKRKLLWIGENPSSRASFKALLCVLHFPIA